MAKDNNSGVSGKPDRAVVVTGASSGIGRACCLHLDSVGYRVFATVRKPSDGEHLQEDTSGRIVPVLMDVTEPQQVREAATSVDQMTGKTGLKGLINNAGIVITGPLEFLPIEELERQFSINVTGQITSSQAFLPLLRRGGGRIINLGSISDRIALPFLGPYAASKAALASLSEALRRELRPWHIPVSLIEAGNVQTPLREKSLALAAEIISQLPEAAESLYGPAFEKQMNVRRKIQAATTVEEAAQFIRRILETKRPKPRYLLGRDARFAAAMARLVPKRVLDRILGLELP